MRSDELAVLVQLLDRVQAELVAGQLRAAGVAAELEFDDVGGAYPVLHTTRGVSVLVPRADLARAHDIHSTPPGPIEQPNDVGTTDPDSALAEQRDLEVKQGIDRSGRWALRLSLFFVAVVAVLLFAGQCDQIGPRAP